MTSEAGKICAICGKCCEGAARIKDSKGRYYHDRCYLTAQRAHWRREQELSEASSIASAVGISEAAARSGEFDSALEGNETMMAHLLAETNREVVIPVRPETKAAAEHGCPDCGTYAHPKAVFCTKCGANLKTGEHLATAVLGDKRKRRLLRRFDPMWRIFDQVAQRLAPGVIVVFALLFISSLLSPDAMLKIFFAAVVAVCLVGHLSMTYLASRESTSTGIAVFLVPLYSLWYFINSASRARRCGIWTSVIGVVLLGVSFGFATAREQLWGDEWSQLHQPANEDVVAESDGSADEDTPEVVNEALATNGAKKR